MLLKPSIICTTTDFDKNGLDGIAGIKLLTEGKIRHSFAIFRHISFYLRIPSVFLKRTKTSAISSQIKYKGSILKDYYIKGHKRFNNLNW